MYLLASFGLSDVQLAKITAFRRDKEAPLLPEGYEHIIATNENVNLSDIASNERCIVDLKCLEELIPNACPQCGQLLKIKYNVSSYGIYEIIIVC